MGLSLRGQYSRDSIENDEVWLIIGVINKIIIIDQMGGEGKRREN